MAQLVDDDIVRDCRRCKHEPPVERERAFCTAASPAGLLISDGNAVVSTAGELPEIGDALREILFCRSDVTLLKGGALDVGQIGDGTVLLLLQYFQIFGDDPDSLLDEKVPDIFIGCVHRDTHRNLSIGINADGTALAVAADERVGQLIELTLILNAYDAFALGFHGGIPYISLCGLENNSSATA